MRRKRSVKRNPHARANTTQLPNTDRWVARQAATTLGAAFSRRCAAGEEQLLRILAHERDFAIDNFDSGLPFEVAVREEFTRLLPHRYDITHGLLVDRHGFTAGQCDVVIFNSMWFTTLNAPSLEEPARLMIPIEGVYAVGEVKQRLSRKTLDHAMEKLVTCHRLNRPQTFAHRLVENRESDSCPHGLTNPLFSFILAAGLDSSEMQPLVERFFDINRRLHRLEVVRCLCVLGSGTISWAFSDPLRGGEIRPALFMCDDLFHPLVPAYARADLRPPLFSLMQLLHIHLFDSILAPEDIATIYAGSSAYGIQLPTQPDVALQPDKSWLDLLERPCLPHEESPRSGSTRQRQLDQYEP